MESALLGLVLDSSLMIDAERKHLTVEEFLDAIRQRFGETEVSMSSVTLEELVHGVARANTPERRTLPLKFRGQPRDAVPRPLPSNLILRPKHSFRLGFSFWLRSRFPRS